jgi:hypothetical protein
LRYKSIISLTARASDVNGVEVAVALSQDCTPQVVQIFRLLKHRQLKLTAPDRQSSAKLLILLRLYFDRQVGMRGSNARGRSISRLSRYTRHNCYGNHQQGLVRHVAKQCCKQKSGAWSKEMSVWRRFSDEPARSNCLTTFMFVCVSRAWKHTVCLPVSSRFLGDGRRQGAMDSSSSIQCSYTTKQVYLAP